MNLALVLSFVAIIIAITQITQEALQDEMTRFRVDISNIKYIV